MVHNGQEYEDSRWFGSEEIMGGEFHPILKQALRDLRAKEAYRALRQAVQGGDAAAAAREFVQAAEEAMAVGAHPLQVYVNAGGYAVGPA